MMGKTTKGHEGPGFKGESSETESPTSINVVQKG